MKLFDSLFEKKDERGKILVPQGGRNKLYATFKDGVIYYAGTNQVIGRYENNLVYDDNNTCIGRILKDWMIMDRKDEFVKFIQEASLNGNNIALPLNCEKKLGEFYGGYIWEGDTAAPYCAEYRIGSEQDEIGAGASWLVLVSSCIIQTPLSRAFYSKEMLDF